MRILDTSIAIGENATKIAEIAAAIRLIRLIGNGHSGVVNGWLYMATRWAHRPPFLRAAADDNSARRKRVSSRRSLRPSVAIVDAIEKAVDSLPE